VVAVKVHAEFFAAALSKRAIIVYYCLQSQFHVDVACRVQRQKRFSRCVAFSFSSWSRPNQVSGFLPVQESLGWQ
jgi:hypothetical protein